MSWSLCSDKSPKRVDKHQTETLSTIQRKMRLDVNKRNHLHWQVIELNCMPLEQQSIVNNNDSHSPLDGTDLNGECLWHFSVCMQNTKAYCRWWWIYVFNVKYLIWNLIKFEFYYYAVWMMDEWNWSISMKMTNWWMCLCLLLLLLCVCGTDYEMYNNKCYIPNNNI